MKPPEQLLASPLPAPPEAVWPRLQHTAFLAGYLGARLPDACWAPGLTLHGTRNDGSALRLTLMWAQQPAQMVFCLQQTSGLRQLQLSLEPCDPGSRLTVLEGPMDSAPAPGRAPGGRVTPGVAPGATPGATPGIRQAAFSPTHPLVAPLATRLAMSPSPALLSGRPGSFDAPAARQQALAYLADTAHLVAALRQEMGDRQGYAQPAAAGFSLVQHLWHLADVEQFGWACRFQRLRGEVAPVLPGVDGDRLARDRHYQQRPWRAAARRFEAQRRRTLSALAECDAAVLRRPVQFSGQPSSGAEMLAALLAHDHEHRVEMAALWPPDPGRSPPRAGLARVAAT